MKTLKPTTAGPGVKKTAINIREEIKSDFPLSEKDEVKKAEERLRRAQKNLG